DTLRTDAQVPQSAPRPAGSPADTPQRTLINQYCVGCHNDRLKSGGLTLTALNLDDPHQSAEIGEKVIRKLRGGRMRPAGAKRPDSHAAAEFVTWLETRIDSGATESKPGRV